VESELSELPTEQRNPASANLDTHSALEIARIINSEDQKVAPAIEQALPQIAQAIDIIAGALSSGGRLIYVGAGTSGRLAALDAAECPPTFGVAPQRIQYVIAGGARALDRATEVNEDSRRAGERDLARRRPTKKDVVVGIAASGRTPYTVAAVEYARRRGARAIAVVCNAGSELGRAAEVEIVAEVGPEALTGSTRMKAGTAQKMILNMLSTGAFVRMGYVYGNLMIYLDATNHKLHERSMRMLQDAAGVGRNAAAQALKAANHQIPVALIMLKTGLDRKKASRKLKLANGDVRQAIESR
jgi:N-acetylmuramic acid 6-phosphate etherase